MLVSITHPCACQPTMPVKSSLKCGIVNFLRPTHHFQDCVKGIVCVSKYISLIIREVFRTMNSKKREQR